MEAEIPMGWIGKKFAGIDELCRYYKELGIDAQVLSEGSPEALEQGLIKQDMGYMKVNGRNFTLVTVRMKGTTSGSYSLGTVAGANIGSVQKIRFEYHHIVRTHVADEGAFKADLKKETKGFLSKDITGISWEGGGLATRINSSPGLNTTIMGFITTKDEMKIEPDKKNGVVRIIFSRPSEIKGGLIYGFRFDRNLLPKEAIDAIDKIATLVK